MNSIQIHCLTFIFCLTVVVAWSQDNIKYTLNDDTFKVEFNTTWTWEDIVTVKQELQKKEIILDYSLLEFHENGQLKKVSASILYKDGMGGSFTSRELQTTDGPGFRHKFNKQAIIQE